VDLITDHLDVWTIAQVPKATGRGKSTNNHSIYGIKKLRELILELAVRGKLVPQNSDDEPASKMLKQIATQKEQLLKECKIKKQKQLPSVEESVSPFNIPETWEWSRIGEITNYGLTDKVEAVDVNSDTWVLELKDVEKETSRLLKKVRYEAKPFRSSKNIFLHGDVIYGKLRPYLDKVLVADEEGVCTTEMIPFRAYARVTPQFLRLILKSPYFIRYANESTHGMNLPRLGTEMARLALIPIVPEAEQHRIVAKVNELMTLCDQLEQQQTNSNATHQTLVKTLLATLTHPTTGAGGTKTNTIEIFFQHFDTLFTTEQSIDQLKQTILQLAVMGKLVPQDPDDEPTNKLLKKIAEEKERLIQAGEIKKQKKLPEISNTQEPFDLPDGWVRVFLGSLVSVMDAGWSPACPPNPSPNNDVWGVLKTTAVQVMQYLEHENKTLPESFDPRPQYEVSAGDILITRAGPKNRVAISCLVQTTRPRLLISDKIIRFHLIDAGIAERYIALCLNAGVTAEYLENAKSGMAESQMNISQAKLRLAPIALCPIGEQHRIITKVDQLMEFCDSLKAHIIDARAIQFQFTDAIVDQAVSLRDV